MLIPVLLAGGVVLWLWSQRQAPLTGRRVFVDASQVPTEPIRGWHPTKVANIGDVLQLNSAGLRSVSTSNPRLLRQRSPTEFVVLNEGRVTIAYDRGLIHVDVPPLGAVF